MSRTTPTRTPEKYPEPDRTALDALIDSVLIGHVAFVVDGGPVVIPTAIARDGDTVLLHGSTGSKWMRLLATGVPVSMAITRLDALVVARSAFESSMVYRSAVLFGRCSAVEGEEKVSALDLITEALIPGRVAELRRHRAKELAATLVLRLTVDEWTLKVSESEPEDGPDDVAGEAWAGTVPLATGYGAPVPTSDLRSGIPVPPSVRGLEGHSPV